MTPTQGFWFTVLVLAGGFFAPLVLAHILGAVL